ncbi:MAG TPA: hypothetical protein PLY35_09495 [Thermotogota bacterium]|nr:hypothetical protein [Thermotogota bacterium]
MNKLQLKKTLKKVKSLLKSNLNEASLKGLDLKSSKIMEFMDIAIKKYKTHPDEVLAALKKVAASLSYDTVSTAKSQLQNIK